MHNLNQSIIEELSISELKELVRFFYPEEPVGNINRFSERTLRSLLSEYEDEVLRFYDEVSDFEKEGLESHLPSRKKKRRRISVKTQSFKATKRPKWKVKSRKTIPIGEETTNRGYLNKVSSSYIKLKPQQSMKKAKI